MNVKIIIGVLLLIFIGCLTRLIYFPSIQQKTIEESSSLPVVAITQIVEHGSLDEERNAIISVLTKAGFIEGKNIKIIYQNAQGNIGTATQIVNQLLTYKPKIMIAISTPSAQAALSPCLSQKIPLVFTAVTDPLNSKLVKDLSIRTELVTGVSDAIPLEKQIKFIKDFFPKAKNIGIIYNPGEANSLRMVETLKEILKFEGSHALNLIESPASKTSEINSALNRLVDKIDVLYIPNDNTAVAAIENICLVAEKNKIPVITCDVGSVQAGALAAVGYNRRFLGEEAGELCVEILQGKDASLLPIKSNFPVQIFMNSETLKRLGLSFPEELLKNVQMVKE